MLLKARVIKAGKVQGKVLISSQPISFFGCVNPKTGVVTEKNHDLFGKNIKDKILVFPHGKGSTVGSYALYRMKKNGVAPKGIINKESDAIIAVGAIISEIPCVDKVKIEKIKIDDIVIINNDKVIIINKKRCLER